MLTKEAAAALLKTLEEPAPHVIFVLATTELHKVLPTILSRCQVYRFRRAGKDEMLTRLRYLLQQEKREAEEAVLEFIAERSDGSYRDAESLLGQLLTTQGGILKQHTLFEFLGLPPASVIETFVRSLVDGVLVPAVDAADEAFAGGSDPEQFLQEAVRLAREQAIEHAKESGDAGRYAVVMRALLQAVSDLAYVPEPMVAVHLAALTVCTKKGEKLKKDEVGDAVKTPSAPQDNVVDMEKLREVWPQVIERVKIDNPVASTFLRAVKITDIKGTTVTVQAQYTLHRNFFENDQNRGLVNQALSDLLEIEGMRVVCILDDGLEKQKMPALSEQRKQQDDQFLQAVQEVFGE